MDKVTKAKNEFRTKQWIEIIKRCQSSGENASAWCRQNNVSIKSYFYWLRKFREKACNNKLVPVEKPKQSIVPVPYQKDSNTKYITINAANVSVDIYEGSNKTDIENVLSILGLIC